MQQSSPRIFEVVATPKVGGGEMVLRRFRNHDAAAKHALDADMRHWDDIWVRPALPAPTQPTEPDAPPALPWSVLWIGGHAYLVDSRGTRIAALLGSQGRRKAVADLLIQLVGQVSSQTPGRTLA